MWMHATLSFSFPHPFLICALGALCGEIFLTLLK
jgi:hypothetical protein